jgi:hypothetical protein
MVMKTKARKVVEGISKAVEDVHGAPNLGVILAAVANPSFGERKLLLAYANDLVGSYSRQGNTMTPESKVGQYQYERDCMEEKTIQRLDELKKQRRKYWARP